MQAPRGTVYVVFNFGSGGGDRVEALGEIERTLRAAGRRYEVFRLLKGADARPAAARAARLCASHGGVLAAAGGDGTINAVAQAAYAADVDFGVVPLGTFNYFARVNGIPLDTAEAARVLAEGVVQPVQIGLVNERVFLVNASVGFYPQLLEDREAFKQRYGRRRWVALLAALSSLVTRPQPRLAVRIVSAGEERTARVSTLFVGNNPLQLERLGIREARSVEEGRLAAIRVRPTSLLGLLEILLHGAVGRLGEADGVESFSFGEMELTLLRHRRRVPAIQVSADGENLRLPLPIVFRVAPHPLRLLRPRSAG